MIRWLFLSLVLELAAVLASPQSLPTSRSGQKLENTSLTIEVDPATGAYTIRSRGKTPASVTARVGAKVEGQWIFSTAYPQHRTSESPFRDELGTGSQLTVLNTGLPDKPDLVCTLRLYSAPSLAEVAVQLRNSTGTQITAQAIRVLEAAGEPLVNLNGPDSADRVLSDSFSEDRPAMAIHDLLSAQGGMHRGVGSQLIYNRQSKQSLFVGALTSERWLTVLRLRVDAQSSKISGYEVDSTGTTELARENSLRESPPQDQMELSLPVAPGESLSSERAMVALGPDYHAQLELYGSLIRKLHHARVSAPTPMGWWSWTAFYFGLNEGTALTNAEFLAQELKPFGYSFFHIDEGYQYARGEYTTPDVAKFPHGVGTLENHVRAMGLTPGIWTAPFEVSQRSWLYQNHPEWLVHNAQGQPIHAGFVIDDPDAKQQLDPLYILDSTNPGAQKYLHTTYSTLAKDWGIRYIKLDFMDDSAIEGNYYHPNTTALQAQRIGLHVIRDAVGEDVLLDKDGSPMLNPVGIVDAGRISQDTGHTFEASRDAATGIAARYYMNRNFFISDPDAFSVSKQTVDEQEWHGGKRPLTLNEAQVSIALSAVSGGMFEIGDDLPTLFLDQDRMALVENQDLINMARYGHASTPLDLMDYAPEDKIPSIFLLRESKRTAILTVFNWTDRERSRRIQLSAIGLAVGGHNRVSGVLNPGELMPRNADEITLQTPPRSVRMLKIEDTSVPKTAPLITAAIPSEAEPGKPVPFTASANPDQAPVLSYRWDFGDGTSTPGASVMHTYTHAGDFTVHLSAEDIEGTRSEKTFHISVKGKIETRFHPSQMRRPAAQP
jgi:alpha-galactosidase